jgi:hypothetical protein
MKSTQTCHQHTPDLFDDDLFVASSTWQASSFCNCVFGVRNTRMAGWLAGQFGHAF